MPDPQQPKTRQPTNWPTAVLGLAVIALLAFVAWLCAGVANHWLA